MNSQPIVSPELSDCISRLRSINEKLIRLIDALIAVIIMPESVKGIRTETTSLPEPVPQVIAPMLQALGSSTHTLTGLSNSPGLQTRDCHSIVRSIFEVGVNICYIIAEGPNAAERAIRHARQKAHRDLERESKISNSMIRSTFSGRTNRSEIEKIEKDIDEFTSRAGREKGWVDLSIDNRIEIAGTKLGADVLNSLHFARFAVYRHSSEIIHGTFFGVLYFMGLTSPRGKRQIREEMAEFVGQQHMLILLANTLTLSAVIKSFHKAYGFSRVYEQCRKFIDDLQEIPYLQEDKKSS